MVVVGQEKWGCPSGKESGCLPPPFVSSSKAVGWHVHMWAQDARHPVSTHRREQVYVVSDIQKYTWFLEHVYPCFVCAYIPMTTLRKQACAVCEAEVHIVRS